MITPAQIEEIVQILVKECQPEKIILFGSYAQGTAQEDSDLDLAVVKQTDLPHNKRHIEFWQALLRKGEPRHFGLDLLVYTPEEIEEYAVRPLSFIYEILTTGKTLYEA